MMLKNVLVNMYIIFYKLGGFGSHWEDERLEHLKREENYTFAFK